MKPGDLVRVRHTIGWAYTSTGRVHDGSTCLIVEVDSPQDGHFATVLVDGQVTDINLDLLEPVDTTHATAG